MLSSKIEVFIINCIIISYIINNTYFDIVSSREHRVLLLL